MEAIVHFCEKGCFWRKLLNWKNKLKESHLTSHCKRISGRVKGLIQKIKYVVVCMRLNKELSNYFKTEGISFPLYDSEHPCEILSHLLTYTVVLPYPQGIHSKTPSGCLKP